MKLTSGKVLSKVLAALLALASTAKAHTVLRESLSLHNSEVLRPLEDKGFSIAAMLGANAKHGRLSNKDLLKLSNYKILLASIESELKQFKEKNPDLGRFFNTNYLNTSDARFVLVGVINRMDRGYATGDRCGEVRFIYRLAYNVISYGAPTSSRLPITVNIVFRGSTERDQKSCAELAQSWLQISPQTTSEELVSKGPLQSRFFNFKNFDRLEINMQAVRAGAYAAGDFGGHAEYLFKVYKMMPDFQLKETYLENQIDRKILSEKPELLAELKKWLLQPANLDAADKGELLIPNQFLAKVAYSLAPGGISRSQNRAYYGLVKQSDFEKVDFKKFENIKSPAGMIRRLNDSTCIGCHQTRAIGGFHFTGRDPFGKYPGNSVFLPGSPHFLGDLTRRQELVESVANLSTTIDYSRGFSARPQRKFNDVLAGTGLYNGWGAHCANGDDPSFSDWSCSQGLECKQLHDISDKTGMGTCIGIVQQVGDPCEFGTVTNSGYGKDKFNRFPVKYKVDVPNARCSPQSQLKGTSTGGFLHGSVRKKSCEDGPGESGLPPEAECGPLPTSRPGFNACIGTKNFDQCLKEFSAGVGQRGCDQINPCRDDYICGESFNDKRGVCVPPYFLFQFRVDGHPRLSSK